MHELKKQDDINFFAEIHNIWAHYNSTKLDDVLTFWAHKLGFYYQIFISSHSTHSCGYNAYTYVSNGAILTEILNVYYASRLPIKTNPFWNVDVIPCRNVPVAEIAENDGHQQAQPLQG